MQADLVLEGGGVKGVALVGAVSVLEEEGYEFPRIAGSSAGAVVGALLAAGYPAAELRELVGTIDYRQFADEGLLDRLGLPGKGLSLLLEQGIFEGRRFHEWLTGCLAARGVHTFADLRLPPDPGTSLAPEQQYRLVVMTSDLSRGRLVRLPWDYPDYGLDPDEQPVADAVRASISIPFFYEPFRLQDASGFRHVLVDGGILSNFPIEVFDRTDARPPRWPTFGIKLAAPPGVRERPREISNAVDLVRALVATWTTFHDQLHLDDPCVARRTIFVDTLTVQATDFDIDAETQQALFANGVAAARRFLTTWDFDAYVDACRRPTSPDVVSSP